jgi:amino-acid N-acetyltransferase
MTVTVRPATAHDLASVTQLLTEAGLPVDGVREILDACADDFVLAVSSSDDTLQAVAGLDVYDRVALLRSVAVREGTRHQGLGGQLVQRLIDNATTRGIDTIFLLTTTADGYFPRFGFERITRHEVPEPIASSVEFTGACPSSAIVMRRRLTTAPGAPASPSHAS